jgi:hypothetical protein
MNDSDDSDVNNAGGDDDDVDGCYVDMIIMSILTVNFTTILL